MIISGFESKPNALERYMSYFVHYCAPLIFHVERVNIVMCQVVTKFCSHLHDVQEGGLKWLRKS